ncbi:MAG: heme exporter protein CcmD [Alphaproteobacteria bacterium]|jgi:heme exporter protein D|nr:heme exporter protein CcmD [Alphaproteobacteria bacterium]
MMPELGRYAVEVTSAYAVSLGLIVALALWYVARGRRVRRDLDAFEQKRGKNG